jgi:hypothetical protein
MFKHDYRLLKKLKYFDFNYTFVVFPPTFFPSTHILLSFPMPSFSANVHSNRKDGVTFHDDCIISSENDCVIVMTESHRFTVHNPRATLREVIKAYWHDSDPLFTRNYPAQSSVQELLDVAIADFPVTGPVANDMEYTIELRNDSADKTESKRNVCCIQLASNYRGFIGDVDLEIGDDAVRVSTETSNFVFPRLTTLRDIARTCWYESNPLLFRNCLPAPLAAQALLDVPATGLSEVQDQLILEIYEKGNILYKD